MQVLSGLLLVSGALFTLIGGIGVIKFPDVISRMHAAAKAPTLGLILVAIGAAIEISTAHAVATLFLVVVLQLLTSPVASHVLGRASYRQLGVALDDEDALDGETPSDVLRRRDGRDAADTRADDATD